MRVEVGVYLDDVKAHLHLDPGTERRVIRELHAHFQEKVADLQDQGLPEQEAVSTALASFGEARSIARMMYEAHSRGSWTEAFISSQPHFIVAALFATHVWRSPVLLGAAFAAIMIIALLGWRNGTPNWLYSWVGYAVLPLLVLSFLSTGPIARTLSYLLQGRGSPAPLWHLAMLAALYAFTIWLVVATTVSVARRDWLLLSLALLPLPVLGIWVFSVTQSVGFLLDALRSFESRFSRWDGAMACFFVALGVTTALFIRLRQRALKVGALIAVGMVAGSAAARSIWEDLDVFRLMAVSICLLLFLTVPVLLHALLTHDQQPKTPLPS